MIPIEDLKQERVIEHDQQIVCCRFHPDGKRLLAAGFDRRLHCWSLEGDDHESVEAHGGWVESMALHPKGERLFTADSWGQVNSWSIGGKEMRREWSIEKANRSWLRQLAISSDGKRLATCGNDRCVGVFSAADGKRQFELTGHEFCVQSVAFHPDGTRLTSGDQHGKVRDWDLTTGKLVREIDASKLFKQYYQYEQGGARVMMFDRSGDTLYCGGFQGSNANQAHGLPTVLAIDWEDGKTSGEFTPSADFKGPVLSAAVHPDGYFIGAGSSEGGGMLWFWKLGQPHEVHQIKNPTSFRGIDLTADGTRIAATAFGDRGGQRGGNGRRLNKEGEYVGFAGNIVLYGLNAKEEKKKK